MKKLGLFAAALILAINVQADDTAIYSNLTIAAAETASTLSWTVEKAEAKAEKRHTQVLSEQADILNDKLNAKLEKQLDEKFTQQLDY